METNKNIFEGTLGKQNAQDDAVVLILGATGRVGSQVVKELDENSSGVRVRLSSSRDEVVGNWKEEGRDAVLLDLDKPNTFADALKGVDRIFLLTGYTSDMLYQSKMLVDAAADAGVKHIVHLGVFTSRKDPIPHFSWHDLVETYIEASGISWTHLHPNVIADSILVVEPPISETNSFSIFSGDTPQGWVFASDIAAVAAEVLREGPEKHGNANYFMSTEVLTATQVSTILSEHAGREIKFVANPLSYLKAYIDTIPSIPVKAYMESALITMKLTSEGKMPTQNTQKDDVQTVLGRPGLTMKEWAKQNLL